MSAAGRTPVASYRVQLGPSFGFGAAIGVLDHLDTLGVSHLYLSPVAEAVPGSEHGYDVVDHTRVRAELGGEHGLGALFDAAHARGMRVLLDHVPNHVSIARPELNARWWDVLRDGPSSPSARWFDIDWSAGEGRVIVPVVGSKVDDAAAVGDLQVDGDALVVHGSRRLPLAPGTEDLPLDELLELQHYVLVWWRNPTRNVRRFFTIDDLVAVRVEEPDVADVVDTIPLRWRTHPAFGGVRVDHVDGIADPGAYLRRLRARLGDEPLVVVEKILAAGESLPPSWPVDGTTGYDFVRIVDHAFLDPAAGPALDRTWRAVGGEPDVESVARSARREVLHGALRPDLERTVTAMAEVLADVPGPAVASAVEELTVALGRYRTYLPDDPAGEAVVVATADSVADAVVDQAALDRVVGVLLHAATDEAQAARTRWQQLTGPVAAKGVEDRAWFRALRLATLCEVGGDPASLAWSPDDLHAELADLARRVPAPVLASSTHDAKRSGDVRARGAALTWFADEWGAWTSLRVAALEHHDPVDVTLALQTAVTCPGLDERRLGEFLVKSAREAERGTSWAERDTEAEARLGELGRAVLADTGLEAWHRRIDPLALRVTVAATVLAFTVPGFPDVYQGAEGLRYLLVDPDNRRPVDWDASRSLLARAAGLDLVDAFATDPAAAKTVVVHRLTALRRRHRDVFDTAPYTPLPLHSDGDRTGDPTAALAFSRGTEIVVAVGLAPATSPAGRLPLPSGRWRNVLCDDVGLVDIGVEADDTDRAVDLGPLAGATGVAVLERIS